MLIPEHIIENEQRFFDDEASQLTDQDLMMSEDVFERYRTATVRPSNIPKDTLFARLRPLEGKRVLDYACGNGENATILAACGAWVTGFDLSPGSIQAARRRADLHGVGDRVTLEVGRAGATNYPPASFDGVVAFAVLHHMHTILPTVYDEIASLLKPGGLACIVEPVADSAILRALRRVTPLPRHATEHERQLTAADLSDLDSRFSSVERHYFYNLERLERVFGPRLGAKLRLFDYHLQARFPAVRSLYGHVLILATRSNSGSRRSGHTGPSTRS